MRRARGRRLPARRSAGSGGFRKDAAHEDHTGGVHSVYAHLKKRSVRVREGDKVKRGQVIGLCGNSGNSSQPHLHFQLQDGPRQEKSWGIDAVFQNVTVLRDGKAETVATYTFLKGDRLRAPGPP
jgi:murein DD-endopeptidase MepM/ murein hydrolase activator NlpD